MQVLKGHTSEETAYLIEDYPYGFKLRCKMKCWLETDAKKGVRFVTQTENPKNGRWNKPKASTYAKVTGVMYLDEKGHVGWDCITEYTESARALEFVEKYGPTDALRDWARLKEVYARKFVSGEAFMTMNGVRIPQSEYDKERQEKEADEWKRVREAEHITL